MITLTVCLTALFIYQPLDESATRWSTPTQLTNQIEKLDKSSELISVSTLGFSTEGLPIQCIQVARNGDTPIDERSAILLVAGIDGTHVLGSEVAIDVAESLIARESTETEQLLETHKIYIIPQVNPDVAHHYFSEVKEERFKNRKPVDDDHDGFIDEDGGDDLNGDGYITIMRVPDLEKATHLINPDEPRLHIKPDALKGQSASFVLFTEGIDDDNDGKYNEDGTGGVDLNKNFMHGYQIHSDGAGPWQLSEQESRILADFVLQHQEIAAIVVYGRHDTLTSPLSESGKDPAGAPKKLDAGDVELYKQVSKQFNDIVGLKNTTQQNWDGSFVAWSYAQYGVPAFSTPLWSRPDPAQQKDETNSENEQLDSRTETPRQPEARGRGGFDREAMRAEFDADGDGELNEDERSALREHMREQFGRPSGGPRGGGGGKPPSGPPQGGSSTVSDGLTPSGIGDISQETLDELLQAAEAAGFPVTEEMMAEITPEQIEQYAKMSGIQIRRVKKSTGGKDNSSNETAWLTYNDEIRNGEGFVEWQPFDHPQLGMVEIGGWVPYFKTIPPIEVVDEITNTQTDFLLHLASKLPDVQLETPIIKKLGTNHWEVKIAVRNDGWFPSGTAIAKRNKRARPYIVRIDVPNESILSGRKVNRIWSLDGGGTRQWFTWIIQGQPNEILNISLFSEKFGNESISLTLQNTDGGGA